MSVIFSCEQWLCSTAVEIVACSARSFGVFHAVCSSDLCLRQCGFTGAGALERSLHSVLSSRWSILMYQLM